MAKKKQIKIGIVGASGLVGNALLKLLARHPNAVVAEPASDRAAGQPISKVCPKLAGVIRGRFRTLDLERFKEMDLVFLCKKSADSLKLVPELVEAGVKIIDIGAEFRFRDAKVYEQWYRTKHTCPRIAKRAVYGLAELKRATIKKGQVIANPGCYPTAVILSLYPLLKKKLVKPGTIVVNAYSGLSGAGAQYSGNNLFIEMNENLTAYKALAHRHQPEMEEELKELTKARVKTAFIPHLIPVTDGIYTTIVLDAAKQISQKMLTKALKECYKNEPFVRVLASINEIGLQNVVGTNFMDCAAALDSATRKIIVKAALDNTLKGAVGQAVQNMNLMFGIAEKTALL